MYLHGVETISIPGTGQTIQTIPSGIIALLGLTDVGPAQQLTLCNNDTDDLQFGDSTPVANIPKTLQLIRQIMRTNAPATNGACPVIVVNIYDSTKHNSALSATVTPDAVTGIATLSKHLIGDPSLIVIKQGTTAVNVAAGGTYVYGTDYTLDKYGNFVDVTGTYLGVALTFTGYYLNVAASTMPADLIGGIDEDTHARTGSYIFQLAQSRLGIKPKIYICPTYSTLSGVAAQMLSLAATTRGVWINDAPAGTTYPGAITGRGSGTWGWNTTNPRAILTYPMLSSFDESVNDNLAYPYSAYLAGMMAANDVVNGFYTSPSNQAIPGVVGTELDLSTGFTDPNSETNLLNAQGIVTYMTGYGLGYNTWGNRNASFPSSSQVTNFINVQRTDDMVSDSMELAAQPYIDKGITAALRDIMLADGNNYIKALIQEGALLPGSAITYNASDNPVSDLANGNVKFRRVYMVYTPAERITYYDLLDITLLNAINQ